MLNCHLFTQKQQNVLQILSKDKFPHRLATQKDLPLCPHLDLQSLHKTTLHRTLFPLLGMVLLGTQLRPENILDSYCFGKLVLTDLARISHPHWSNYMELPELVPKSTNVLLNGSHWIVLFPDKRFRQPQRDQWRFLWIVDRFQEAHKRVVLTKQHPKQCQCGCFAKVAVAFLPSHHRLPFWTWTEKAFLLARRRFLKCPNSPFSWWFSHGHC